MNRNRMYVYIGLFAGIAIGAIFGQLEYGEPVLGAIVGSGVGPIITWVLRLRFPG